MKVRVVENSVKSQVGRVYDSQKRTLGSTPKIDRITRPSRPNVDVDRVCAASGAPLAVCKACFTLGTAAVEASTRDVTALEDAMITEGFEEGIECVEITECSPPQICREGAGHKHPCWSSFQAR